ncbi:protein-disulfide reductase DsbD domain-containing protein [Xinfangfangia pollutisoli]|uniref:protein-disulfide reductase DsbD domain-containing protein n=1 Tax=Xinfangfangia pollutisoli TaxID=2865960 RepID=UPI001CD2D37D|nr:protein-disulfide reductase DsbD domain-containing protein [Xinfangfangia pollutisoli]
MLNRLALSLCLPLCLAALPGPAAATTQDDVLEAAVLTGWQTPDGTQMTALRLRLAPGWKTYWRSPGDAGIPPEFDWSGSRNLKAVQIHWPAPSVFHTAGFTTIGYHDELVLPVEIRPRDPSRPVDLEVTVDLGICRDICLPASLHLTARIDPPGAPDASIRAALAARPKTGREAGLAAISCGVEPIADGLRLTATLTLPQQGGVETVAIETADRRVWVSEAEALRKGGTLKAVAELVPPHAAPFALDRSGVTVTVISDKGAMEVTGCPAP